VKNQHREVGSWHLFLPSATSTFDRYIDEVEFRFNDRNNFGHHAILYRVSGVGFSTLFNPTSGIKGLWQ
jgi:hypothetical protein